MRHKGNHGDVASLLLCSHTAGDGCHQPAPPRTQCAESPKLRTGDTNLFLWCTKGTTLMRKTFMRDGDGVRGRGAGGVVNTASTPPTQLLVFALIINMPAHAVHSWMYIDISAADRRVRPVLIRKLCTWSGCSCNRVL